MKIESYHQTYKRVLSRKLNYQIKLLTRNKILKVTAHIALRVVKLFL